MAKQSAMQLWRDHFKSIGLPHDLIQSYMVYVERMHKARLPVIFEFRHLAALFGRTPAYLASAIASTSHHYRTFKIRKRSGGMREIAAPYPALLECQQWILTNILKGVKLHAAAHGFVPKKTIKTNALCHLGHVCLLKMDLKDFFPSITIRRVVSVFRRLGYPKNISSYLARLCTLHGRLPQGSAASPALSNIIARKLDKRLCGLAKSYELVYTRYADDMVFSGSYIPLGFRDTVETVVKEEGYEVNGSKTKLVRFAGRRMVTGLVVSGKVLMLPRSYKRKLRQEVYYIVKYGYLSHVDKLKVRKPYYLDSLLGKLTYWKWVEPDNKQAEEAIKKLKAIRQSIVGI